MRTRRKLQQRQQGTTLLIALIFLVILTLFAVSGMNTGIINLRTANNAQLMIEAQAAAQKQVELLLNSVENFLPNVTPLPLTLPDPAPVSVDHGGYSTFTVDAGAPRCLSIVAAPGTEYKFAHLAPKDTVWTVSATANDNVFGTKISVWQGVKIRLPVHALCYN